MTKPLVPRKKIETLFTVCRNELTSMSYAFWFIFAAVTVPITLIAVVLTFSYSLWYSWSRQEFGLSLFAGVTLAGAIEMFRHHPYCGTFIILMSGGAAEYVGRQKQYCMATVVETGHYTELRTNIKNCKKWSVAIWLHLHNW